MRKIIGIGFAVLVLLCLLSAGCISTVSPGPAAPTATQTNAQTAVPTPAVTATYHPSAYSTNSIVGEWDGKTYVDNTQYSYELDCYADGTARLTVETETRYASGNTEQKSVYSGQWSGAGPTYTITSHAVTACTVTVSGYSAALTMANGNTATLYRD